jgi:hypothetical protein
MILMRVRRLASKFQIGTSKRSRRDLRFDTRLPVFSSAKNGVLSQVAAGSASPTRHVFSCNELRRSPREYRGTEMSELQAWRLAGLIFGSWLGLILLDLAHQILSAL